MTDQAHPKSEMAPAEAVRPLQLVGYQQASVVSRTLLKRTGGTITMFAFDAGQGLSEHRAPFDAVAHVLEGDAEITIAGRSLQVSAGEMVLMPANQPHAVSARIKFKMLLTMIRSVCETHGAEFARHSTHPAMRQEYPLLPDDGQVLSVTDGIANQWSWTGENPEGQLQRKAGPLDRPIARGLSGRPQS